MRLVCPNCQNTIDLVDSATEAAICPSCGSTLQLEEGESTLRLPQEQTLGKFVLLHPLGTGAFGTVYKARDPELDRPVAIKVPRAGNLAGQGTLERFLREARSVAQLRHPAIVPVYEVGQHNGLPYLVSELVEGVDRKSVV